MHFTQRQILSPSVRAYWHYYTDNNKLYYLVSKFKDYKSKRERASEDMLPQHSKNNKISQRL